MRASDVKTWLLDECETLFSQTDLLSLSTPSEHVDVANSHDDETYPFIGVQGISSTPDSAGIGNGEMHVDSATYSNGTLQSITYRRDVSLRVRVIPVTDDDPKLRDDLTDEVADHFSLLVRTGAYPEDMDAPSVGEATPQDRPDDFVRADGVPIEIEYERYVTDENPDVATTVNLDLDVADDVEDVEGTDAIDATFN